MDASKDSENGILLKRVTLMKRTKFTCDGFPHYIGYLCGILFVCLPVQYRRFSAAWHALFYLSACQMVLLQWAF